MEMDEQNKPIFNEMIKSIINNYSDVYSELKEQKEYVIQILDAEEKKYNSFWSNNPGVKILYESIKNVKLYHTINVAIKLLSFYNSDSDYSKILDTVWTKDDIDFLKSFIEKRGKWMTENRFCSCELCNSIETKNNFTNT